MHKIATKQRSDKKEGVPFLSENLIEANSIRMDSVKNKERRRECQRIAFLKLKLLGYISFLALENQCILKKQYQQISLQLSDCINLLVAWQKSDAERK